jgi:thiol:disulfide interchange protein DsbC
MINYLKRTVIVMSLLVPLLTLQLTENSALAKDQKALTKDEAAIVLRSLSPDIRVISVEPAVVEGLWEVVVEMRGSKNILYLDSARRNVISGSIIDLITRANLTKAKFDDINRVDFASIPLDDTIVMGDPKAKHKVIVFDDPD